MVKFPTWSGGTPSSYHQTLSCKKRQGRKALPEMLTGLNVLCLSYFSFFVLSVFALNKRQYAISLLDVADTGVNVAFTYPECTAP